MEGGRDDFFTKKDEEKFPSLKFYSARMVYYINMNTMHNLLKTGCDSWKCCCFKYSGCRKINGVMDYCDYCQLEIKHNPYDNQNYYKIKNLIKKHIDMINDFKKHNIDIYTGDYTFKCWILMNIHFMIVYLKNFYLLK